jgi:2'-5' RNA ligase
LQDEPLTARAQAQAKRIHLAAAAAAVPSVLGPQLDELGIAFDLGSPFAEGVLEKVGTKGVNLGLATRDVIVQVIGQAYEEGWTVNKTAAALQENIDHLSTTTAVMQARTDLVGLANASSIASVKALGENAPAVKVWLATADERTRETHADADGQEVPLDQPFQVGDDLLNFPGDPDGSIEETANCRCAVIFSDTSTPEDAQLEEEALAASADGPDVSTLAMVAVYPRPEESAALAVDGGQEAETIHCTLIFLGEADSFDHGVLAAAVRGVADTLPPLEGTVGGAGHFAEGPDGYPAILMPDVQGLSTLQESLRAALAAAGIVSPSEHGFTPHMTQAYAQEPTVPDVVHLGKPLHFDSVSVTMANERTDYALSGAVVAAAVPSPSSVPPRDGVASVTVEASPESLTAGVTITVDDEETEETLAVETPWSAILCVEGEQTEDGRLLDPGSITWRDTPLPLGAMFETPHSYDVAAPIAGRIDRIWRDEQNPMLIRGEGIFNTDEAGCKAVELIGNESLRGISVDLMVKAYELRPAEPPVATDSIPDDGDGDEDIGEVMVEIDNTIMAVTDGVIGGATVCPVQAIANATISITASAGGMITVAEPESALTAAASPPCPPLEWFQTSEPPGLMPLTVTDDGRVFGHLASFDSCHTAFADACIRPPRSASNYGYFHVGELEVADGGKVAVGKLMIARPGRSGKHAPLNASRAEASRHYDDHTAVGAYIRVVDGRYGPWAAGVVRAGLDEDSLAQLRANPPSGDWRRVNGSMELIAALSVPVPGFPVPRAEAALVASAESVEVDALIASSGQLAETAAVRRALERAGVLARDGEPESDAVLGARIQAKAARALGRDALISAALDG